MASDDDPVPLGDAAENAISNVDKKRIVGRPFQPGQIANPFGRPKGSRNRFGEDFIAAFHADFREHGVAVIAEVRRDKPADYLKIAASILPKELHVKDASLDDMSDEELIEMLAAIRAMTRAGLEGKKHRKPKVNAQLAGPPTKTVN